MEPLAIPKAVLGLDQSDAVGVVAGVQGPVAPVLFEAVLAQALPAVATPPSPQIPGVPAVLTAPPVAGEQLTELPDTMVAALSAASLTAQRGVQSEPQIDTNTPALIAVPQIDSVETETPALSVSVPTVNVEMKTQTPPLLVVRHESINHDLVARAPAPPSQTMIQVMPAAEIGPKTEAPLDVALIVEPGATHADAQMRSSSEATPIVNDLQLGEVYGQQRPADMMQTVEPAALALEPSEQGIEPEAVLDLHEDSLKSHVTMTFEGHEVTHLPKTDQQILATAQPAPKVHIVEARLKAPASNLLIAAAPTPDERKFDSDFDKAAEAVPPGETNLIEIDPALVPLLAMQAPPANMARQPVTSEPDLVHHARATVSAAPLFVQQSPLPKPETQVSNPFPAHPVSDAPEAPVVTYLPRQSTAQGDGGQQYAADQQQQNESRHSPMPKEMPTFTRAHSASLDEGGMTLSGDVILARVEDATQDLRSLARFNVREIELSLATSPKADTSAPAPVAPHAEVAIHGRNQVDAQLKSEVTSSGEDARRFAAHETRLRALERMVVNAAREGSDMIKMQLYPPGLGQVIIRLNMEGSRLRLSTRTSNQEATEALRNLEQGLRDALSTSGLDLAQFDVSEDGQERNDAPHQQPAQSQPKRGGFSDEVFAIDMNV